MYQSNNLDYEDKVELVSMIYAEAWKKICTESAHKLSRLATENNQPSQSVSTSLDDLNRKEKRKFIEIVFPLILFYPFRNISDDPKRKLMDGRVLNYINSKNKPSSGFELNIISLESLARDDRSDPLEWIIGTYNRDKHDIVNFEQVAELALGIFDNNDKLILEMYFKDLSKEKACIELNISESAYVRKIISIKQRLHTASLRWGFGLKLHDMMGYNFGNHFKVNDVTGYMEQLQTDSCLDLYTYLKAKYQINNDQLSINDIIVEYNRLFPTSKLTNTIFAKKFKNILTTAKSFRK
jgi:hypothetical protein